MDLEEKLILILLNLLFIALPVALWEITIEKDKGWGAGLPRNKWYGKIIGENNMAIKYIAKIIGIPYFFGYTIAMYFITIPVILVFEYFLMERNAFLLVAVYVVILTVEDFLWFVFNWNFDSLKQLFKGPKGNIWWHKRWVKIHKDKYLPLVYFSSFLLIIILIAIS